MVKYDAIVVGSGNAGLTGAVSLANAGQKVLLVEQNHEPGGNATSFKRGRFTFEASLHEFMQSVGTKDQPGDLFTMFDELGVGDKIKIKHAPNESLTTILPSGKRVVMHHTKTPEELTQELIFAFPDEASGIQQFMQKMLPYAQQFMEYMNNEVSFSNETYSADKYAPLRENFFNRIGRIYDKCNLSKDVRAVIESKIDYFSDTSTEMQPGFIVAQLLQNLEDGSYVEGGSQSITDALINKLKEEGGDLLLDNRVEKIIVEDQKVKGVVTDQNKTFEAPMVLTDMVPTETYIDLVGEENTPQSVLDQINQASVGYSACNLFLGLDCPPEEVGIESALNFVDYTYDLDKVKRQWHTLEVPDHLLISSHCVVNPTSAPSGAADVSIFTYQAADQWLALNPSEYNKVKERYTNDLLNKTEQFYPNIREHIEECELATPITLMRYNSQPKGSIMGWEISDRTEVTAGPQMAKSPIKGLFITGASIGPGFYGSYKAGTVIASLMNQELTAGGVQ